MPFKIVRNDITKMNTEAIVNTANDYPTVGTGCDFAVYKAAGYDELLKYRQDKIGIVQEGEAFITPGFKLQAKYIIHAVSPFYIDGEHGEERLLRSCYRKSLAIAKENNIKSISFPLISTGGFGYPKEEGMRIAVDEINAFLLTNRMDITLVVFDKKATELGENIYPKLQAYIDHNYVLEKHDEEYGDRCFSSYCEDEPGYYARGIRRVELAEPICESIDIYDECKVSICDDDEDVDKLNKMLNERLAHKSDTFSEYLLYLIESKGMTNVDVYKRAIVDKRYFAKLKNNKDFHPEKIKALCLCVGAKLNLDETKDLLARAGYALSPADMTDIIFSFYIEHNHFDVIDIDIQLEEHGLPCIIS